MTPMKAIMLELRAQRLILETALIVAGHNAEGESNGFVEAVAQVLDQHPAHHLAIDISGGEALEGAEIREHAAQIVAFLHQIVDGGARN